MAERKAMIDREHAPSITRQVDALGISRGSVYYLPRPVSDAVNQTVWGTSTGVETVSEDGGTLAWDAHEGSSRRGASLAIFASRR